MYCTTYCQNVTFSTYIDFIDDELLFSDIISTLCYVCNIANDADMKKLM